MSGTKIEMIHEAEDIVSLQQAAQGMFEIKLKSLGVSPDTIGFDMISDTSGKIMSGDKIIMTADIDVIGFVDPLPAQQTVWQWIWTVIDMPITQQYRDKINECEDLKPFCVNEQNYFVDNMHFKYMLALVNYHMEYELTIPYVGGKSLGLKNIKYAS